ncbi:hypothetical protein EMCRGX_G012960 [Ephydatia muelleri]
MDADGGLGHEAKRIQPADILVSLGAGLSISHLEVGSGWGQESSRTRQADILVTNWDNGISAAFEVTVASPLNSSTITEAGMYSGAQQDSGQCGFSLPMDWSNDCNHANGLCEWEHYPTSGVALACPWIGAMTVTMPMDCANGSIIRHQDAEKTLLLVVRTEDAEKVLLLVVRTEDAEKALLLVVRTEDAEKVLLLVVRTEDAEKVLLLVVRTEDAEKVLLLVVRTEDAEKVLLLVVRTEDAEKDGGGYCWL